MSLSREEIAKLADLAALDLAEDETRHLMDQLEDILDFCSRVAELPPADGVFRPDSVTLALRDDVPVRESLDIDVPRSQGFIIAPRASEP